MAQLNRIDQLVFGDTGGTTEFGKIGSDAAGSPETTKDLAEIQSLSQFRGGLYAITASAAEPPRIEDLNALYFLMTSQLRYLFQNGVPEWHAAAEYFSGVSYCQKGGVVYRSVTNDNVNHDPATDDGTNWEAGDWSVRQLKFDLDRLGFSGYALYTDRYLPSKLQIATRHDIGDMVTSIIDKTPTAFAASKSTAHPSYPEYCPIIPRHDANHDITTTEVPQSVIDVFNAHKFKFGVTTDFTVTLSSGVATIPSGADGDKLLNDLAQMAYVNRWFDSGESATYEALGPLYTGARQYCGTINNVNYAITAVNIVARTITFATYPTNGTYTLSFYPHRIAGYTDRSRLRKISGQVAVAAGDATGENLVGGSRMDRFMDHYHGQIKTGDLAASGTAIGTPYSSGSFSGTGSLVGSPTAGSSGATPRTGKTTDPRSYGVFVATHVQTLYATTWTSA